MIPDSSEEFTAEGGHGAVPTQGVETGAGVPKRASWPLYEVFVRGKRGLNHVHVGSLHAADAEMALHNARDLYTRRNEGVSIWVVRADGHHRVQPGREGPVLRPGRRQGLPAPDVLRDPGGGAAPVTPSPSPGHHTEIDEHDPTNAYQSLADTVGHDDPRWAFGTGVEDVQAEITSPVPDGVDPADLAAYCLMLGDDALVCSQRLSEWVSNAPELEEEVALANTALDLLGQARVLLARAAHVEGAGHATRTRWPTCAASRSSATSRWPSCPTAWTSPARSPGCCCSRPGGWRCCTGCSTPGTRCSPRSPARASRS